MALEALGERRGVELRRVVAVRDERARVGGDDRLGASAAGLEDRGAELGLCRGDGGLGGVAFAFVGGVRVSSFFKRRRSHHPGDGAVAPR